MKMLQASMDEHDKQSGENAKAFLDVAKEDMCTLIQSFMTGLDEKMGDYLSDIETKKDEHHWDEDQCDDLRGEIISMFNYQNICKYEVGAMENAEEPQDDGDATESDNEEEDKSLTMNGSKKIAAAPNKRGRAPTKKASVSKGSSEPLKKRGRPMKNPNGKPVSYIVEVGTKIMYEEEQYIAVDSRVGGPGMCQIGVSKNGEKEIVEYDENRGHMKKAEVSKLLRKGATIYES